MISCKACTVRQRVWNQPPRPSALVIQLRRESKVGTRASLLRTSHKSTYDQLSSQQCQGSTQQEVFQVVVDYGLKQFLVMATILRITTSWMVDNVWTII